MMIRGALLLTIGVLILGSGCAGNPPPPSGMADTAKTSLRGHMPSNARFVLRVPRVADKVSETVV